MADGSSLTARVLTLPRVGIGMTTAALVALASGGTGLLVAHGTRQLEAVPGQVLPLVVPSPPTQPVLVDRAPGSLVPAAAAPVRHVAAHPAAPVSRSVPRAVPRPVAPPAAAPAPPPAAPVVTTAPPPSAPVATAPQPDTAPPPPPAPSGSRQKKAHRQDQGRHLGQLKKQQPQDQQQDQQDGHPSKG